MLAQKHNGHVTPKAKSDKKKHIGRVTPKAKNN